MTPEKYAIWASSFYKRTPEVIWQSLCDALRAAPKEASLDQILSLFPGNLNSDIYQEICSFLKEAARNTPWAELGYRLQIIGALCRNFAEQQTVELLWSGPPSGILEARRTDQVLYDLINSANKDILLVTFAAAKVSFLKGVLLAASQRGVEISMVLEFEQESAGQLKVDAIAAFPELASVADIFYWPYEKRQRNVSGRPGKLHAKCAVIDDSIIIGSANLTEDAFDRNMEIGLLIKKPQLAATIRIHFKNLIDSGVLQSWK
jgi:phosphatidylserine/phosphatidylglycerophosphate/cardiolipin synthase-like enzyme